MAVLGLRCCARAFSSCGKWGPLFIAVRGPLTIMASLVSEHRLQTRRLSSCGSRAWSLRGMWDLPRPGLEPVSPALAGRFSTTAPPGKPQLPILYIVACICQSQSEEEISGLSPHRSRSSFSWNVRNLTAQVGKQLGWQYPAQPETSAHPSSQLHTHSQLSTSFLPSSQYLFLNPAPSPQPGTLLPPPLVLLLKAASLLFPHWQELSGGGEQLRE